MKRSELLSSTAALPAPVPDVLPLLSGYLRPGETYTVSMPAGEPPVITFDNLREFLERADKQHAERRILTKAEQDEIWANRYRPMPTEAEMRKEELATIMQHQHTAGSFAEFMHWQERAEYHLLFYGDGTDRVGGLFSNGRLTSRRK